MIATTRFLVLAPLLLVLAAACGSDDDSTSDTGSDTGAVAESDAEEPDTASDQAADEAADESSDDAAEGAGEESEEAASDAPATGGSAATLTLANGEVFEFATILCTLEPQMAAGSEILFTATSYDDPGLDITQFGDEGTITGIASISVYDDPGLDITQFGDEGTITGIASISVYNGDFETLWEANSMLGSSVELTVEGSTIRGTGSFYEGEEFTGETVEGEVVANC